RPCAVQVLPGAASQSSSYHCCTLALELLLVFDQEIGKLSSTSVHANRVQQFEDFRLAHPSRIVQGQYPGSDSRPKLAFVANWHFSQIRLRMSGRVVFLFEEINVLSAKVNVLYDEYFFTIDICC